MFNRFFNLQLHAVTLTPEEQTKFDELMKERGFDGHAQDVIKRTNEEAKKNREAAEAATKTANDLADKVKSFETTETERAAAQKKKDDEAAAAQKKIDDEKKTIDQRIDDLRTEMRADFEKASKADQDRMTAELKALTKKLDDGQQEITKRDALALKRAVREAAKDRGIIDVDLADFLDVKEIKITDGEPDMDAIVKVIEKHAEEKPMLYKSTAERDRDDRGRFSPATPSGEKGGKGVDWSTLDDKTFEAKQAEMRAARNRL